MKVRLLSIGANSDDAIVAEVAIDEIVHQIVYLKQQLSNGRTILVPPENRAFLAAGVSCKYVNEAVLSFHTTQQRLQKLYKIEESG